MPDDFSLGANLLMGCMFLVGLVTYRGLYDGVPFLASRAIAVMLEWVAATRARMYGTFTSLSDMTAPPADRRAAVSRIMTPNTTAISSARSRSLR